MRTVFTLEGSDEGLQGVIDWAKETWGASECQTFYRPRQLSQKKLQKVRIFRYSRIKFHESKLVYPVSGGPYTKTPERTTLDVAVWGKDHSALFKLRWA